MYNRRSSAASRTPGPRGASKVWRPLKRDCCPDWPAEPHLHGGVVRRLRNDVDALQIDRANPLSSEPVRIDDQSFGCHRPVPRGYELGGEMPAHGRIRGEGPHLTFAVHCDDFGNVFPYGILRIPQALARRLSAAPARRSGRTKSRSRFRRLRQDRSGFFGRGSRRRPTRGRSPAVLAPRERQCSEHSRRRPSRSRRRVTTQRSEFGIRASRRTPADLHRK